MEFFNFTPCPSMLVPSQGSRGERFQTAFVRATFTMAPGGVARLAQEQRPLVPDDVHFGDPRKTPVREESNYAPFKPHCDVVVNGTGYAPNGLTARRFDVGLKIFDGERTLVEKSLVLTGPRVWKKRWIFGWHLSEPDPVRFVPVRYDLAYGGDCRVEKGDRAVRRVPKKLRLTEAKRRQHSDGEKSAPAAHAMWLANPTGRGFAPRWFLKAKKIKRVAAPQIESPVDPVRRMKKNHRVEGFGFIARGWEPRRALAGTHDVKWFMERRPDPPLDFDPRFRNGAHPDLQIPYLRGDERVQLDGWTPSGRLQFELPGHLVYAMAFEHTGRILPHPMAIDTLFIEPDENRFTLIWRARFADDAVRRVETRLVLKENAEVQANVRELMEIVHA